MRHLRPAGGIGYTPPMPPPSTVVRPLTVAEIADALMGVESSNALLARLEDLLGRLGALPARLYLFDADSGSFYAAAGLGCTRAAPEIPLIRPDAAPANHHLLRSCGEWVGLLEILATEPCDSELVALLAALLGPTLIAVHRQAGLIDEVTQLGREVRELVTAGELLRHLDVEVLLSRILETAIFAVRAQVGAVLIADEQDQLTVGAALGLSEQHIAAIQGRDGRSIAAAVQDGGVAICVGADEVRQRLDLTALEAQGVNLTGLLALPLTIRGRGRGVVLLANPEGDFNAGERRIAETVCSLAAIALDNALLVKGTLDRERMQRELDLAHSGPGADVPRWRAVPGRPERRGPLAAVRRDRRRLLRLPDARTGACWRWSATSAATAWAPRSTPPWRTPSSSSSCAPAPPSNRPSACSTRACSTPRAVAS